jgi:hypothetical protein
MELKTNQSYKRYSEYSFLEKIPVKSTEDVLKVLNELEPGSVFTIIENDRTQVFIKVRDTNLGNYKILYFGKGFDIVKEGVLEIIFRRAISIQIRQDITSVIRNYSLNLLK